MTNTDRRAAATILAWAVALTAALGFAALAIAERYDARQSYAFDPASYQYVNAELAVRTAATGRLDTAATEWFHSRLWTPLRTVPLVLFAPDLLTQPRGHLATALPTITVFLSVLGWCLFRRHNLFEALAGMTLFCACGKMLSPIIGISSYWLDLPAALLVGAALLCLTRWHDSGRGLWLTAFAVLVSAATLCRFVAAGYALVMGGPLLLVYLLRRRRDGATLGTAFGQPLLLLALLIGVLCGPFLVLHGREVLGYYDTYGYDLGSGAANALVMNLETLWRFGGRPFFAFLTLLAVFRFASLKPRKARWAEPLLLAWPAMGHLLFLGLVLEVRHLQASVFALPPIFFLAVSPWPGSQNSRRFYPWLATGVLAVALALTSLNAMRYWRGVDGPVATIKEHEQAVANTLAAQGEILWNAYVDGYAASNIQIIALETFYGHGVLPQESIPSRFYAHENAWQRAADGREPERFCLDLKERLDRYADAVLVYDDPNAAANVSTPTGAVIAACMADRVADDPRWQRLESFAPGWALYGNTSALDTSRYRRVLLGEPLIR